MSFTKLYMILNNNEFLFPLSFIAVLTLALSMLSALKISHKNKFTYRLFITLFLLTLCSTLLSLNIVKTILIYTLYTLLCLYFGKFMLVKFTKNYSLNITTIILEFILGFYSLGIIYFIVSHRFFANIFGGHFSKGFMIVIFILIILSMIYEKKRILSDFNEFKTIIFENNFILVFLFLSITLSIFIVFDLNVVSIWGWLGDKFFHVTDFASDFNAAKGYPFKELTPWGFQSALLAANIIVPGDMAMRIIQAYNFFGIIMVFITLALPYIITKQILNSSTKYCYLASFLTIFYGALGAPFTDPYMGFMNISTHIYHNTTTFFTIPIMLLLSYFSYLYFIKREVQDFAILIILLDLTFLIKQNAYMVLAPVIGLIIVFYFFRNINFRTFKVCLFLGILLIIPAVYWIIYPKIFSITQLETNVIVGGFCNFYLKHFNSLYPQFVKYGYWINILIISISSFLGIILASLLGGFKNITAKNFYYKCLIPIFVFSLLISCFLLENNERMYHGNFTWQVALIGVCLMPYIANLIENIKNRSVKYAVLFIILLHIFSGIWHLLWVNIV